MFLFLVLNLVIAEQFSIANLLKNKDLSRVQVLEKLGKLLSKSDNNQDFQEDAVNSNLVDTLIQELEKEQDDIPINWVDMETEGPSRILRVNKPSKTLVRQLNMFNFDIWHLSKEYADVFVPYDSFNLIGDLITEHSPKSVFQVLVTDVEEMIIELGQSPSQFEQVQDTELFKFDPTTWFNDYHPYDKIIELFDQWVEEYPDIMSVQDMGLSYEKRKLLAYHVKPFPEYKGERNRIYIQSLVHAREWYSHYLLY